MRCRHLDPVAHTAGKPVAFKAEFHQKTLPFCYVFDRRFTPVRGH
jgi:hypothetical protein